MPVGDKMIAILVVITCILIPMLIMIISQSDKAVIGAFMFLICSMIFFIGYGIGGMK
jgi:hypothetical protein